LRHADWASGRQKPMNESELAGIQNTGTTSELLDNYGSMACIKGGNQ